MANSAPNLRHAYHVANYARQPVGAFVFQRRQEMGMHFVQIDQMQPIASAVQPGHDEAGASSSGWADRPKATSGGGVLVLLRRRARAAFHDIFAFTSEKRSNVRL